MAQSLRLLGLGLVVTPPQDARVLPSLREGGGAVVMEAMAVGLPVIATNWGGPGDYLNSTWGILVEPASKEGFVKGLTDAMLKLTQSPELRPSMGCAGRERVRQHFDWEGKVDRILEISTNDRRLPEALGSRPLKQQLSTRELLLGGAKKVCGCPKTPLYILAS